MFCCDGFRNLLSLAGQRGLAILVREDDLGIVRFVVQARGIAYEDEGTWAKVPFNISVNVASVMGLQYCPTCGCELRLLTLSAAAFFNNLAKDHKKFLKVLPGL